MMQMGILKDSGNSWDLTDVEHTWELVWFSATGGMGYLIVPLTAGSHWSLSLCSDSFYSVSTSIVPLLPITSFSTLYVSSLPNGFTLLITALLRAFRGVFLLPDFLTSAPNTWLILSLCSSSNSWKRMGVGNHCHPCLARVFISGHIVGLAASGYMVLWRGLSDIDHASGCCLSWGCWPEWNSYKGNLNLAQQHRMTS